MTRVSKIAHRLTSWSLIIALVLQPVLAQAQSIVVQGADTGPRPRVDTSLSGHPVLNISRPNAAGVSHDIYTAFETGDTIVNNSAVNANTQLGGFIEGNPNLSFGSEANTWIGEVVGGNQTRLTGILEVAGPGLDLVLANEEGITCDGCGFVNTTRTTLTTGKPVFGSDGSLSGFDVKRGYVQIGPGGLNPADRLALGDTGRVDVIARAVQLYGAFRANEANIIAGANVVDYGWSYDPETGIASGVRPQAGTGQQPAIAIDSSALGGMYAGAIKLIATEAGVGFRMNGEMAASSHISISNNGWLSVGAPSGGHTPTVKARKKVRVRAAGPIVLEGTLASEDNDQVQIMSWNSGLTVVGEVTGGAIELKGAGIAAINGAVTARNALKIISETDSVTVGAAADLKAKTLEVTAASDVTLAGVASVANTASLSAGRALSIANTGALGASNITLSGTSVDVSGLASAASSLTIDAGTGGASVSGRALADSFELRSDGTAEITGTAYGRTSLSGTASNSFTIGATGRLESGAVSIAGGSIANAGILLSTDNLSLGSTGGAVTNSGSVVAGGALTVTGSGGLQNSGLIRAQSFDYVSPVALSFGASSQVVADTLSITAPGLANAGLILGQQRLALNTTSGTETLTNTGILSGAVMTLTAAGDVSQEGMAQSTGALTATAQGTLSTGAASQTLGNTVLLEGKGVALAGQVSSTQSATLTAGTDGLTSSADLTASSLSLTSAGNAQLGGVTDVTGAATLAAAGTLGTNAGSGFYANDITVTTNGPAVTSSADLAGEMIAADALAITTTGSASLSGVVAGKTASLTAGTDAEISGFLAGSETLDVTVTDTATTTASGILFSDKLTVDAGTVSSSGALLGTSSVNVTTTTGALAQNGVAIGDTVTLTSAASLAHDGRSVGLTSFDGTATGALSTGAASEIAGGRVTLRGATANTGGLMSADDALTLSSQTGDLINTAQLSGKTVTLTGATSAQHNGILSAEDAATVVATTGNVGTAVGSGIKGKDVIVTGDAISNAGVIVSDAASTLIARTGAVSNSGTVSAGSTLTLSSPAALENSGLLLAGSLAMSTANDLSFGSSSQIVADDLSITAASLSNAGLISGRDDLDLITSSGDLSNSGDIAGSDVVLSSAAAFGNSGRIHSSGALGVTALGALGSDAGAELIGQVVTLTGRNITNAGLINGVNATLTASDALTHTGMIYLSGVAQLTGGARAQLDGSLRAHDARIEAAQVTTGAASVLETDRDLLLIASTDFTHNGRAAALGTLDARVTAGGAAVNGTLHGEQTKLAGSAALTLGSAAQIIGQSGIDVSASALTGGLDASDFSRFFTNGNLKLAFASGGLSVGASEQIAHSGNLALSLGGNVTNAGVIKSSGHLELWSGGTLLNNEGKLLAGGDMVLSAQSGAVTNRSGSIEAGGGMVISSGSVTNEYRSVTVVDAVVGDVEVIIPDRTVLVCTQMGMGPNSGNCEAWEYQVVPGSQVTLTGVSAGDLPPESCFTQTSFGLDLDYCSDLAKQIEANAQGEGVIKWGDGTSVTTSGARPEILANGNLYISSGDFKNDAGLISGTGNVSFSAGTSIENAAYIDSSNAGQADYFASSGTFSSNHGQDYYLYRLTVSNVTSTTGSGTSYTGEILAGGNLSVSGGSVSNDGTLSAGSGATVAPRHSTSVAATALPTLALGTSAPSASSITAPPSGSIAALAAGVASRSSVSAPGATPSLSAQGASGAGSTLPVAPTGLSAATFGGTGAGSAPATDPSLSAGTSTATIVLPVIARPGSFNTDSVNELIDQGTTRLGSARASQEQFLTSNYMMDVDRLQYRDELLFNRADGLPFLPGQFGQSDEALLQQSYDAAIAGAPGVAFRAAGPTLLGGAGFGLTQDGSIRLAALSQERGSGALTVTGGNITSAGGRFTATGGITITADQSALFTGATIDGASVTLRANQGDLSLAGSQVTAVDDLSLQAGGSIDVYALSESFESFTGPSDNRTRTYGTRLTRSTLTSGGDFSAIAGEDIKIAAAKVDAGGDATLSATGDIVLAFASETNGSERQGRRSSEERFNSTSVVTELTTGGALGITGRNVTALGTRMAAGTSARIDARETLIFGVAEDVSTRSNTRSSSSFFGLNKSRTEESVATGTAIAAQITSGTSIDLIAGGNAGLIGTDIDAGRNLGLDVGGTLSIAAARDTRLESSSRSEKGLFKGGGNGFLSLFGSETTRQSALQSTVSSAELSAGADLTIRTGGDMNVSGSILEAGSAATLDVDGTLAVAAAADTFESSAQEQKKGFGLSLSASGGGFSLFAGARRTRSETGSSGNSIVPSQLVAGTDLTITAGRDVVQAGSRFASGSTRGAEELLSATDEGGSILVTAGGDILSSEQISEIALNSFDEEVRVGITLSVSSSTLNAVQQIGQSVGTATSGYGGLEGIGLASGVIQGTQGLTTIAGNLNNTYGEGALGPDLYKRFTNPVTGLRQNTPSGLNGTTASALGLSANVSIGVSRSQNRSDQSNATASVSSMEAQGGSVTLKAGRDVGLQGTEVTATKDILLDAGRDLSIVSAQSLYQTDASSRSQSASLGMDIFSGTPTASASANRSNSTVSGTAQSNASLSANGSVSLQSGRDTVIAGARVEGDSLSAKVGRDLTLASRQDTETTTGGSDGVSVSLTGGSASKGNTEGSKAWVTEQTGLAADGALRIEVEGHTQIDGAVIASRSDDLALETGTLGFSDITDKERSSAVNATLGLRAGGMNVQGQVAHVDREQINRATVGAGQIAITDPEAQARLTQTDATAGRSFDIAKLNRDIDLAQEITKDERSGTQFYVDSQAIEEIVKGFPTVRESFQAYLDYLERSGASPEIAELLSDLDVQGTSDLLELQHALQNANCGEDQGFNLLGLFVRPAYAATTCEIELNGTTFPIPGDLLEECAEVVGGYLVEIGRLLVRGSGAIVLSVIPTAAGHMQSEKIPGAYLPDGVTADISGMDSETSRTLTFDIGGGKTIELYGFSDNGITTFSPAGSSDVFAIQKVDPASGMTITVLPPGLENNPGFSTLRPDEIGSAILSTPISDNDVATILSTPISNEYVDTVVGGGYSAATDPSLNSNVVTSSGGQGDIYKEAAHIADGHAGTKHLSEFEDLGIYDQDALGNHIASVLEKPTHAGDLERGRSYSYDQKTNTLVIRDPSHPDGGTIFRPTNGIDYIDENLR